MQQVKQSSSKWSLNRDAFSEPVGTVRKILHQTASPSPNLCGSSTIIICSQSFYLINNINIQRSIMDLLLFAGASFSNALCLLEVHWSEQLQVCRQKLSRTIIVVFMACAQDHQGALIVVDCRLECDFCPGFTEFERTPLGWRKLMNISSSSLTNETLSTSGQPRSWMHSKSGGPCYFPELNFTLS